MQRPRLGLIALALISSAGCATSGESHDKAMSDPIARERSANDDEAEVNQASQARLYLVLAQKEVEQAKELMRQGNSRDAASVLRLAQSDADLAIMKARDPHTKVAAQDTKSSAQALSSGANSSAIGGGPLQPPPPAALSPRPTPVEPSGPMSPPTQAAPQPGPQTQGAPQAGPQGHR